MLYTARRAKKRSIKGRDKVEEKEQEGERERGINTIIHGSQILHFFFSKILYFHSNFTFSLCLLFILVYFILCRLVYFFNILNYLSIYYILLQILGI